MRSLCSGILRKLLSAYNISDGGCRRGGFQCGSLLDTQARAYMRHAAARAGRGGRTRVCETGVYHGFSAITWLCAHPAVELVAFDIVVQPVVSSALQRLFQGRVELHEGSSLHTLPAYQHAHPSHRCDIVSVDGGHFGYVPLHDLYNFALLAPQNDSLVLMDEVGYLNWAGPGWRTGVDSVGVPVLADSTKACCPDATIAWRYACATHLINERQCFKPGGVDVPLEEQASAASAESRGWCEGVYASRNPATAAGFAALGIPDAR